MCNYNYCCNYRSNSGCSCCCQGPAGPRGPIGPQGPQGSTGPQGTSANGAWLTFNAGSGVVTINIDKAASRIEGVVVGNSSAAVQNLSSGELDLLTYPGLNMTIPKNGRITGLSFYVRKAQYSTTVPTTLTAEVWINRAADRNTIFRPLAGTQVVAEWPLIEGVNYTRGVATFTNPPLVYAGDRVVVVIRAENNLNTFSLWLGVNATIAVESV